MKNHKPTVYLGLSGGVDSAVAAALLLEQGYDVHGIFLKIWSEDFEKTGQCPWVEDRRDAIAVAAKLGIPFQTWDFQEEYKKEVFSYFVHEYEAGRTPNPDILCNPVIKFGSFLEQAFQEGADYIATGHHVRRLPESGNERGPVYQILRGIDEKKDQSYFLSGLNQHQIQYSLFPIGQFTKEQVRQKAAELGLDFVADKPSTKGICFIGDIELKPFLQQYTVQKPGPIITQSGEVVGHHDGIAFYTIGQRKGLGIPASNPEAKPYFVIEKRAQDNTLVVSDQEQDLMGEALFCQELHWVDGKIRPLPLSCLAKIRYNQPLQEAKLSFSDDAQYLRVEFDQPQRAITPGQVIVFYTEEVLLGKATIA